MWSFAPGVLKLDLSKVRHDPMDDARCQASGGSLLSTNLHIFASLSLLRITDIESP